MVESTSLILLGDLNFRCFCSTTRDMLFNSYFSTWGLNVNIVDHFRLRKKFYHKCTWSSPSKRLWAQCDYIYGQHREYWTRVRYIYPRNYSSDHLMVIGTLQLDTLYNNNKYLLYRTKNPLSENNIINPTPGEQHLGQLFSKRQKQNKNINNYKPWMSKRTLLLIQHKTQVLKLQPSMDRTRKKERIKCRVRKSLQ